MKQVGTSGLVAIDLISDNEALNFAVAGKMAGLIMCLTQKNGCCMPQDLNKEGFSPLQVAENWNAAHFLIAINELESWGLYNGKSKT